MQLGHVESLYISSVIAGTTVLVNLYSLSLVLPSCRPTHTYIGLFIFEVVWHSGRPARETAQDGPAVFNTTPPLGRTKDTCRPQTQREWCLAVCEISSQLCYICCATQCDNRHFPTKPLKRQFSTHTSHCQVSSRQLIPVPN